MELAGPYNSQYADVKKGIIKKAIILIVNYVILNVKFVKLFKIIV